jgi:tetratricopeptide (TPR) repeat protein
MGLNRFWVNRVRCLLLVWLGFCLLGSALRGCAQFGPLVSAYNAPQAKSQQELDDYLEAIASANAETTAHMLEEFASKYPKSELLAVAFQHQMSAYQSLNDFNGMLRAGRRALDLQPGNVNTLLTLSSAIPDGSAGRDDEADLLRQAEEYACRALQGITIMKIPRQVSLPEWEKMQGEMVAQAHEALGHIATKRGNLPRAIAELEMATHDSPTPSGSQFFRLGVAYALAGEIEPASKALHRAVDLGPEGIRQRSLDVLKHLSSKDRTAAGKPSDR